ncbi:ABC transporter substrate-binding protein [soil metagenome]
MRSLRALTVLMAVLALLLAACGSDSAEPEPGPGAATDGDDTAAGEGGEGGELSVWIGFTDYRLDWMNERASEFEEAHPEYTVAVQGYDSYEALFQATQLAAEQGDPPAIVQYFEVATQEARDAVKPDGTPLFASVEAEVDGRDEILGEPVVLEDVVEAARNYYTIDGEFTSMPWNTSSTLLYANADLMEAGGVTEAPTTWEELEAACEQIRASDEAPENCITWPNHGWFFEQSVGQQGGLLANNDNGRDGRATEVTLDDPAMLEFAGWWAEQAEAGNYVYTGTQRDWEGTQNAFVAQQVPFILTSSGDATAVVEAGTEAGFGVEVARMPYNGEVTYDGNLIGGATLWLVNGLDEPVSEGALAFMQFVNNPENAADWHKTTGYIPITNASVDLLEEEGWFEENPYHRVANEQLDAASGSPASTGALLGAFVGVRDVMTQAMEDVLVSGADPQERFEQANEEAQAMLDEYNSLYVTE